VDSFTSIFFYLLFAQPYHEKITFYYTGIFYILKFIFRERQKETAKGEKKKGHTKIQASDHRVKMKILSNISVLVYKQLTNAIDVRVDQTKIKNNERKKTTVRICCIF